MWYQKELSTISIVDAGIKTDFWKRIEKKQKTKLRGFEMEQKALIKGVSKWTELDVRRLAVITALIEHIEDFLRIKNYVKAKANFEKILEKMRDKIDVYRNRIEGN